MIKELLYKWFGLDPTPCATCEVYREQLHRSEAERVDLLRKLLEKDKPDPVVQMDREDMVPLMPRHIPLRVRRQMLEQEDRKQAQLIRDKEKEIREAKIDPKISALEQELGIEDSPTSKGA